MEKGGGAYTAATPRKRTWHDSTGGVGKRFHEMDEKHWIYNFEGWEKETKKREVRGGPLG